MGWSDIDLSTVNPAFDIVAEGEYVFQLGGAKWGENDPARVEANATIVSEGDQAGRKIFFSYPDPTKPRCEWSPKALKRLEVAMGEDALPGEDPVTYLNRAAGSKFGGRVKHGKTSEEYPNPRAELNLNSVKPAA